jgi:hypothetical protein
MGSVVGIYDDAGVDDEDRDLTHGGQRWKGFVDGDRIVSTARCTCM